MKRRLLFILTLFLSLVANAVEVEIGGLWYNLVTKAKEAEVIKYRNGIMYNGDIVIPESIEYEGAPYTVTSIGTQAFYQCKDLTSIIIPNTVKRIGDSAFTSCKGLTSFSIPNNVTSIEDRTFSACSGLTSIIIPDNVVSIGLYAFSTCSSLISVTIPSSVKRINAGAFEGCTSLTSVHISDIGAWCNIIYDIHNVHTYYSTNPLYYAHHLFLNGEEVKELVIPNSVTSIGNYAFYNCSGLTSVNIPNSVTSIGHYAFYSCHGLTSVTIPSSVTSIGSSTFAYCTSLTTIPIPNSVTNIGLQAFLGCNSLNFVNIPNSVTSIQNEAFMNCSSLTAITIGSGLNNISSQAFANCEELTDVYCFAENVPSTSANAFYGSYIGSATLHVPASSISSYSTTEPWSEFGEIVSSMTYTLTYMIDGQVYKKYNVDYDTPITPEPAPTKEGYTFSGWSEIPATMPAHNVTITGSFIPNNYSLTYKVDGNVFKTYTVAYGSAITPEPAPTKEGYTFSGWSEIPQTMPNHDVVVTGSFTINSYTLTYKVDGEIYKTFSEEYGTTLTPIAAPTKEGRTFSGWSGLPATMPAHNVTVTGCFQYTLTYIVDGNIYKTYTIGGGTSITPEPAPTKEGYTFSGWTYIPPTMPASDVVVMGTFTINNYSLTYKVDGQVYKTYTVEYGAAITPEPEPTKEGYTFSGWSTIPSTMPAHNVTVTGTFTKIIIKCATPTISYSNGKLTFNCETEGAICHSTITDTDITSYSGNEVDLTVTYYISVYATKEDFEDSEVATGTLCWIDQQPSTEGIVNEDAVTEVKALPVLIQSNRGTITVQGANEGTEIMVYSVNGMKLGSAISTQGLATISTSLQPGTTAIVKIGEKAIKVMVK